MVTRGFLPFSRFTRMRPAFSNSFKARYLADLSCTANLARSAEVSARSFLSFLRRPETNQIAKAVRMALPPGRSQARYSQCNGIGPLKNLLFRDTGRLQGRVA